MRTALYAALACLASLVPLASCGPSAPPTTMKVTVGGKTFDCKLAVDTASREQGLGGVASLGPTEGMLFAFPDSEVRRFWMRRCIMDLDIAFIDPFGFVTAVHTMPKEELQRADETEEAYLARLKGYPSVYPAQFVLEVAPGTLAPLGVNRGSRAEFDREALKRLAK
ncbi:MAG: DUF192 domain-containing protein [Planctomycetaceae bacterium]|nr:DUF192 domain-containing protein [Planctomycetaceae bacterium]